MNATTYFEVQRRAKGSQDDWDTLHKSDGSTLYRTASGARQRIRWASGYSHWNRNPGPPTHDFRVVPVRITPVTTAIPAEDFTRDVARVVRLLNNLPEGQQAAVRELLSAEA